MDKFYIAYFLLHVVITLAIDSTIALPRDWVFAFQRQLGDFHIAKNHDLLVASKPTWLKTFVWVEILLQTPFFVWASYDLWKKNKRVYPAVLAYGVEASTTTLACVAEVAVLPQLTTAERLNLVAIYLPTLLIPLYMAYDFFMRISTELTTKAKTD